MKTVKETLKGLAGSGADEPTSVAGSSTTVGIVSLISSALLVLDLLRRYFDLFRLDGLFDHAHHYLAVLTIGALLYAATAVQRQAAGDGGEEPAKTVFAFSKGQRSAAKILACLVVLLYSVSLVNEPKPTPPTLRLAQESYDPLRLRHDLVIQNDGPNQVILVKVGVRVGRVRQLHGPCSAGSDAALAPIASYVVRFPIREGDTTQRMDPSIRIPPNDAVRFTVTAQPTDASVHVCTEWTPVRFKVLVADSTGLTVTTKQQTFPLQNIRHSGFSVAELVQMAKLNVDPSSRAAALRDLARVQRSTLPPEVVESVLLPALRAKEPSVRGAALESLGHLKETSYAEEIGKLLTDDPTAFVRMAAAEALGELRNAESVEVLGDRLASDDSPEVQAEIAAAIGRIGGSEAEATLLLALREGSYSRLVANECAESLAMIKSLAAVPLIIQLLEERGLEGPNDQLLQTVIHGDPQYRDRFVPDLLRLLATSRLTDLRRKIAYEFKVVYLKEEPQLDDSVINGLRNAAVHDLDTYVRQDAIVSMAIVQNPAFLPEIIGLANDGEATIRAQALRAMGSYKNPSLVEQIARSLFDDPSSRVQAAAAGALGTLQSPAGEPFLINALTEPQPDNVTLEIARALVSLRSTKGTPQVISLIETRSDLEDIDTLLEAIFDAPPAYRERYVPTLVRQLEISHFAVFRRTVAAQLGYAYSGDEGAHKGAVIEALRRLASQDSDSWVRDIASGAFEAITGAPPFP